MQDSDLITRSLHGCKGRHIQAYPLMRLSWVIETFYQRYIEDVVRSAVAIVFSCWLARSMGANWIRVASPHLRDLYRCGRSHSTAGPHPFRAGPSRAVRWPTGSESSDSRIRVLLFSSERDYAALRPGVQCPGLLSKAGPNATTSPCSLAAELDRVILHEYTHSVLNHSSAPLPQWLEEGSGGVVLHSVRGRRSEPPWARRFRRTWKPSGASDG